MRLDPTLSKACRLSRSGKHDAAMRILLPEVTRYSGSFIYHCILGTICLHAGDYGSALTYLRLAHEMKPKNPAAVLGLAALYLRRSDTSRAVDLYLDVLDVDGGNRTAKKAMGIIRRQAGTEVFSAWLESGKLPSLYPSVPFPGFSPKEISGCLAAVAAVFVAGFIVMVQTGFASNPFRAMGDREVDRNLMLTWEDRVAPVVQGDSQAFMLDRGEAVAVYEKALSLFSENRDEAARVQLNRILESNAADSLKNRASLMLSFMETPAFDTFRRDDNVSYAEAWQNPALYRGVHVIWRGIASNVSISDSETSFDFLLGNNAPIRVEGMVRVFFDQAVPMPEGAIEVLGRIVPSESDGRITLEGLAIRMNL